MDSQPFTCKFVMTVLRNIIAGSLVDGAVLCNICSNKELNRLCVGVIYYISITVDILFSSESSFITHCLPYLFWFLPGFFCATHRRWLVQT